MATDILLFREKTHLSASDPISFDFIEDMKMGEQVVATIKRARNPDHHAKFFVLLTEIVRNQDFYFSVDDLLDDIKISVGHYELKATKHEECGYRKEPKSISFANMGQEKFKKFWDKAVEYIGTVVVPGIDKDDLERRVNEILEDKRLKLPNP